MHGSTATSAAPEAAVTPAAFLRDLVSLTKPRLSSLVVLTAGGGAWLAPGPLPLEAFLWAILGTTMLVGAANAINCTLERDVDRFMARTSSRPLPAERLDPAWGVIVGLVLAAVSLPLLWVASNPLTAMLGAAAFASYVFLYTPLKRRSPMAVFVGTVPGAMPTLMGWSAVTGAIEAPAVALFAILALWQIPHFLAIATFREREYAHAGFRIAPVVWGRRATRLHALLWAVALVPVAPLPTLLGAAGPVYAVVATAASVAYAAVAARGLRTAEPERWARKLFLVSLLYVPVVFLALFLDGGA